jgi:hypothetical protein
VTTTHPEGGSLKPSALHLLTDDEARRVAHLVIRDNEGVTDMAVALDIVDESLKFQIACAKNTTRKALRPSRIVDMGWHATILHTEINFKVASQIGCFIHHRPEGPETLRRDATALDETVAAIREVGYEPNEYYWGTGAETEIKGGDCMHSECHQDGSCIAPQILEAFALQAV